MQTFLDSAKSQGSSAHTTFGNWYCSGGTIPEDFPVRTGGCVRNNGSKGRDEIAADYTGPLGTSAVAS
ncbi:hypothetical protein [Yinghuangia soli]|uniref:Uncharacterized protein n=1 Tax=Yinghuangia soli TaxID=2908204 RepID=A0AA41Q9D3_9ACTN|nr:hypothetical protein [Yinghuangia soli]MCF2533988.1 hypothetical protein [Yinghuangia soli]